jgi:hypothetical protein
LARSSTLFWLIDQSHPVHFAVTAEVEGDIRPAGLASGS